MAADFGPDIRFRVIAAVDNGATGHAAVKRFGVGVATAIRWLRAWRDEGRSTALPMGGDVRSHRIEAFGPVILAAIKAQKDITLAELADLLRRDHGAAFASSAIWRFLDRHEVTFKKTAHASEQERPDVAVRRQAWRLPGCAVGLSEASAAGPACRMGIGKRPPSWAHCVSKA